MRTDLTVLLIFTTTILPADSVPKYVGFFKPTRIAQILKEYFNDLTLKNVEGSNFCMYFFDNTSKISMNVVNGVIKVTKCPAVTLSGDLQQEENLKYKPTAMIVFLGDQTKLSQLFEVLLNVDQYNVRIPTIFILCKIMEDDNFLENMMLNLWKQGFIRYVIIILRKDLNQNLKLQTYTYNPFQNLIYRLGRITEMRFLFPDFLWDLHGYQLRIGFFENWPSLKKSDTLGWLGVDYHLLQIVTRILNATYKIVEPRPANFLGAHNDLVQNRSDICLVKYFQMIDTFENVEFSYPLEPESARVFAPSPQLLEQYNYIFMVYDHYLWMGLGICFVTIVVLLKLVVKYHHSIPNWALTEVFLEVWCIMLSLAVRNLYNSKAPVKCVIIPWMSLCLVLSVGFQCNLRNQLQFPKYRKGLETLQEIVDNNVTIYSSLDIRNIPLGLSGLSENVVVKPNQELRKMCQASDYSGVFVFPYTAKKTSIGKHRRRTTKYVMLAEPLLTGHGVYIFKKNSPYVDKFNKILLKQRENGLYLKMKESMGSKGSYVDLNGNPERITVFHLQGVFLIHFSGVIIGLTVFFLEIGHVNFMNFLE